VIVYCSTRKRTEEMYSLYSNRIKGDALVYHGGMDTDERSSNQFLFMTSKVRVMFATNAFGLGIDKSDIRGVFHRDFPKSLEDYVQETGRAGRDDGDSTCIFYQDHASLKTQGWFIDTTYPSRDVITRVYNYLRRSADGSNIVRLTNFDLARKVGVHEAYISSTMGILIGAKVIERPKNELKTFRLKILKSHADERYKKVFSVVEEIGILGEDGFYEVDINFACDHIGKKMPTVKNYLKTLNDEGYVYYVPPFRGAPTKLLGNLSLVDFDHLAVKARQAHFKLQKLIEFASVADDTKHAFLQDYFLSSDN
jgi:ATP-dependent DNA helicase RecQ